MNAFSLSFSGLNHTRPLLVMTDFLRHGAPSPLIGAPIHGRIPNDALVGPCRDGASTRTPDPRYNAFRYPRPGVGVPD